MDASALLEPRAGGGLGLRGSRCPACGHHAFPPRSVCSECASATEPAVLVGTGAVHAWTLLATPPAGFDEPVVYAAVDLDEGPRVLAPLVVVPEGAGVRVQVVRHAVRDGHAGFGFAPC